MLVDKVNEIYTVLTATPSGSWLGTGTFPVTRALDPSQVFESGTSGIWIVPVVVGYNLAQGLRRGELKTINKQSRISLVIFTPFSVVDPKDVSSWAEISTLLNFREAIEERVNITVTKILEIEAFEAMETMQRQRAFLSVTDYVFEGLSCGSR